MTRHTPDNPSLRRSIDRFRRGATAATVGIIAVAVAGGGGYVWGKSRASGPEASVPVASAPKTVETVESTPISEPSTESTELDTNEPETVERQLQSSPQEISTLSGFAKSALRTDIGVFKSVGGGEDEISPRDGGAVYRFQVVGTSKTGKNRLPIQHIYDFKTGPTIDDGGAATRWVRIDDFYRPKDTEKLVSDDDPTRDMPWRETGYTLTGDIETVTKADTPKEIGRALDDGELSVTETWGPYDGEDYAAVAFDKTNNTLNFSQTIYDDTDRVKTIDVVSEHYLHQAAASIANTQTFLVADK